MQLAQQGQVRRDTRPSNCVRGIRLRASKPSGSLTSWKKERETQAARVLAVQAKAWTKRNARVLRFEKPKLRWKHRKHMVTRQCTQRPFSGDQSPEEHSVSNLRV